MSVLERIHTHADLSALSEQDVRLLCLELRNFLVEHVSRTGGHLASNLGVVELTVALHKVFDLETDRLVFDVGHQSYVHKILTGRADRFTSLRQLDGLSGFPKPSESNADAFIAGHASNAVSAALGMARARTLQNKNYNVIALLGDGALTGGLAYEGLNDAGESGEPLIVIVNDNGMSISRNVGGISRYLAKIRLKSSYYGLKKAYRNFTSKVPGGRALYRFTHRLKQALKNLLFDDTMFEEMGFTYLGPVDGHDVNKLCYLLNLARDMACPVVLHVTTQKGKGYAPAEQAPNLFHGIGTFDPVSGVPASSGADTFAAVFGSALAELAVEDPRICAVSAAMVPGTGLSEFFERFPNRCFDVGIAEGHAVSMAAGLAKQGMVPVVAIYSTFLQRAYDMLIHDVSLLKLHVVFAVDRAGLVGEDGETHQGSFDVGYLRSVPGMSILCPANFKQLRQMLYSAVYEYDGPVAIRYPRGCEILEDLAVPACTSKPDVTLVSYGILSANVIQAANLLKESGICADVIILSELAPLNLTDAVESVQRSGRLVVAEDTAMVGCIGTVLLAELETVGISAKVKLLNLGSGIVRHGSVAQLWSELKLDADGIVSAVMEVLT